MKLPTLTEPTKPSKQSMVSGVTDMGNYEYAMENHIFIIDLNEYKMKTDAWEDLNARIYNLCLQHCLLVLEPVQKANSRWGKI